MNYDIVLTENAKEDLEAFVSYILHEKQNPQAARSILDDFDQTTDILSRTAGSLKLCFIESREIPSMWTMCSMSCRITKTE